MLPMTPYRKTSITLALPILIDGPIQTLERVVQARQGDYLCIGEIGEIWVIRKEHFEAEKRKLHAITHHIAAYASTGIQYGCLIEQAFTILDEKGAIKYTSDSDGGYLLWNGEKDDQFAAWIVRKDIFRKTYEVAYD